MDTRREVRQRFLCKVQKTTRCWEWTGKIGTHGYGIFGKHLAHRFSYELFKGEIPVGHQIRHKCDNRRCVRPGHLLTGTHKDNAADREARGRGRPHNSFKTHCPKGHLYEHAYGQRICRTCRRETSRRWNEKVARGQQT